MDVIKAEMSHHEKTPRLGLIRDDDDIFEVACRKELVGSEEDAGLDLEISEYRRGILGLLGSLGRRPRPSET